MSKKRIESIDILRGLVMILMALDHVRAFYLIETFGGKDPTDIETTTVMLFLTRFITHFCAPAFLFLAGTSAYLYEGKTSKKDVSKFLISRGLWLIIVEIFIISFLWFFDPNYSYINLQVIWAIGICMIFLGLIIYLPFRLILAFGCIIVLAHPVLEGLLFEKGSFAKFIYTVLYSKGWFKFADRYFAVVYSIIPWLGLMLLGYNFGKLYTIDFDKERRKKLLLQIGSSAILLFFILRFINDFGDTNEWKSYDEISKSFISFFNVTKYPASLDFILITMGPSLLFLYSIEDLKNKITDFFLVFGRVPFFYYILHFLVIHAFAISLLYLQGQDGSILILVPEAYQNPELAKYGYSLEIVYLIWIGIVLALYPISKSYMNYKTKNKDKMWLSYL